MFKSLLGLLDALPKIIETVGYVVTVIELLSTLTGEKGDTKEDKALEMLKKFLPPDGLPKFFQDNYDEIARVLIRAVVAFFNAKGFFSKSS